MKTAPSFAFLAVFLCFATSSRAQIAPAFKNLTLIEEIDTSKQPPTDGAFREHPDAISQCLKTLDGQARTLPNDKPGPKYFGYLLGKGKNLKAGEGYVLELVYPEDAPRTMFVMNMGCETSRGFHTGRTTGDVVKPLYVNNIPESLEIPLSNRFETWQELFFLHDRYGDLCRPRGDEAQREGVPANGFWVYIGQFAPEQDPLSQGAAVSKIRLYKAPALESYSMKLNLPPSALPQRHIFFREEMADNVFNGGPDGVGVVDSANWYEYKARLMKFLGMDAFSKDLLEFGANQGWDSSKYGGNNWVYQGKEPQRWNHLLDVFNKYGLSMMPYFEYSGSKGKNGLGIQKRAIPLKSKNYTHVTWAENARADLTDPETFEDFRKMLEITMADVKDKAKFIGAWIRPRPAQLPISFSDNALALFVAETKKSAPVTRDQLSTDKALYGEYIVWWLGKRKEFLNKVRDYVQKNVNKDAVILYTADATETGARCPGGKKTGGLVAENVDAWKDTGQEPPAVSLEQAIKDRRQYNAMMLPRQTFGNWEWQHASPQNDPGNYKDNEGVLPTFSFNRAYTVADAEALQEYETRSGLAMIRHFALNENMFREETDGKKNDLLGYFVADMEYAGPYSMFAEARAVANGDPRFLGYLSGNSFNRGFPQYARNFNAAFLSLPGLTSKRIDEASSDSEVVVRKIDAGEYGTYFAVVNTGYQAKKIVKIKLPVAGKVINAATNQEIAPSGMNISMDLYPFQLVSLHVLKP